MRKQSKEVKKRPFNLPAPERVKGKLIIIDDRCKGCGFCVEFCPKKVLYISESFNKNGYHPPAMDDTKDCVMCWLCELICPDFAIYLEGVDKPQFLTVGDKDEHLSLKPKNADKEG